MTTSTNSVESKIRNKLLKAFPTDNYDIETSDDELLIKDKEDIENIIKINYEDLKEEFSSIKKSGEYYTIGDGFLNFVLVDNKKSIRSRRIQINGIFNGTIVKEYNALGLMVSNIEKIVDFSKLKQNKQYIIEEIVDENLLICDLQIDNELLKLNKSELEIKIDQIINSILAQLALKFNVILHNPRNLLSQSNNTENQLNDEESVSVKYIEDFEPVLYFLAAEEIEFPHLRYLEYYHVLEYYFLYKRVKAMDDIVEQLISTKLTSGDNIYDGSYYSQLNELLKYKFDSDFNREIYQLKDIILNDIGFNSIKTIVSVHKLKLNFLAKVLFDIDETTVSTLNKVYDTSKNKFKNETKEEDRRAFCNELALRIYKIRNHIVHTKKFEKSNVFVPSQKNYEELKNDIALIRLLSYFLMTS